MSGWPAMLSIPLVRLVYCLPGRLTGSDLTVPRDDGRTAELFGQRGGLIIGESYSVAIPWKRGRLARGELRLTAVPC